jgi:hypothetical protein
MDSFGFCNRHAWQIPKLPAICAPAVGYSIFASDLLRKFNFLVGAITQETRNKGLWRSLLRKGSQPLFPHLKARVCPACSYVAKFEAFHLKDLLDFITEEEFLQAYNASQGICLPHLFLVEKKHSSHTNFPLLLKLQLGKSQFLRETLEEFIRKQDRRFQDQITVDEARAWRVAMEFLTGKPGVFNNEMRVEQLWNSRGDRMAADRAFESTSRFDSVPVEDLVARIRAAKQVTVYQKQPLPKPLVKRLKELVSGDTHPTVEIVAEDLSDVTYLRQLHSSGIEVFYGVGLPLQPVIFIGSERGFVFENNPDMPGFKPLASKGAEDLYYRLLWCRFGHAVLLSGSVKETDAQANLFCITLERERDVWCRLRDGEPGRIPGVGRKVVVFGWEKWLTHILDVIQLDCIPVEEQVLG